MPKKENIRKMFDGIAPGYDYLNHLMSLGIDRTWRHRALREVTDGGRPLEILDVACGTGDFSIAIARALPEGSRVRGIDISDGMLSVMRRKVLESGLQDIVSCQVGDSEALPFEDGCFDRVTIAFGIRNFEHREQALREILRLLKPGGKLVILELSVPTFPPLRWAYNIYFTKVMPLVGGRISGDRSAYLYLPASVLDFPSKDEWMETMRSCGYSQVRHKAFTCGVCRMYVGEKPQNR